MFEVKEDETDKDDENVKVKTFGPTQIPIVHLHGLIPSGDDGVRGDILFSERDYALNVDFKAHWRSRIVRERLRNSTCLFVGLSLKDPALSRYIHQSVSEPSGGRKSYAVLSRQGDSVAQPDPVVRKLNHGALVRRLEALSFDLIRPDFFIQVPQFLNELSMARSTRDYFEPSAKLTYGQRLLRWRAAIDRAWQFSKSFPRAQRFGHKNLLGLRRDLVQIVERHEDTSGDRYKAELWVRNPGALTMELWASSEAEWRQRQSIHRGAIRMDSPYLSIRAFCLGSVYQDGPDEPSDRWNYFIVQPIRLTSPSWNSLPVGVVTFASAQGKKASPLAALSLAKKSEIKDRMLDIGEQLLDPDSGVHSRRPAWLTG